MWLLHQPFQLTHSPHPSLNNAVLLICSAWVARRFDANNDGVLDAEEQKALVDAFGAEYKESIGTALEKADENHDGKVDAREVAKLLAENTESESDAELTEDEESDDDDHL